MNGVKGLIIKEFYLRRKSLLSGLTVFVLFFILAASFCLSFDYGNMKNNEAVSPDSMIILVYAISFVTILLLSQNGETIIKDTKCKWYLFEYTTPLSAQKLTAVRVGLILCSNIISLIISLLCSKIIFKLAHKPFTLAEVANISVIALIGFIIAILVNAVQIRYKNPQKAAAVLFGWLIGIYAAAVIFAYVKISENVDLSDISDAELDRLLSEKLLTPLVQLRDTLFPFFILFFAAAAIVGYFIILAQVKRREK